MRIIDEDAVRHKYNEPKQKDYAIIINNKAMEGQDMNTITSLLEKRVLRYSGLVFCVMVTVLCMGLAGDASAASHTLTLTSSGAQSINATGAGGAVISSDSINVATTCRSGYNFTINTSVNDNNLYLGGDASKNESGKYFTPADGTTTLANSTNTWGYYYNASNPSTTPTSSNIFSPVPTLNSPTTVISPRATPSSTDINDNFNIYYGVSVSPSMPVGTYKMIPDTNNSNNDGTIVYTATIAEDCLGYRVHFNPTSTATGTAITGTGTMSDQNIRENTPTLLTANGFAAPNGYYFAGWNTAQDGSGVHYVDRQEIINLPVEEITLYAQWEINPAPVSCRTSKTICYNSNSSLSAGTMPEENVGTSTANLRPSNFKRDGYGFAGWNTAYDYSGVTYGPEQKITLPDSISTSGLALYAVWVPSAGLLQNWNGCSSMNVGDVTALTDSRDNDTYAVAKLADNKCWMIENLRLDDSAELSSTNTNNPSLPLNNSWYYDDEQDTLTTSNHLSSSTSTSSWCTTSSDNCINQSMLSTDYTTLFADETPSPSSPTSIYYSYGNEYNWYSATAGNGTSNTSIDTSVAGDICPAGWHLPRGGLNEDSNEFMQLNTALGGDSGSKTATGELWGLWRSYPNNYITLRRGFGRLWTSTSHWMDSPSVFTLTGTTTNSSISLSDRTGKNFYASIRCISGI